MSRVFALPHKAQPRLATPRKASTRAHLPGAPARMGQIVAPWRLQAKLRIGDPDDRYEQQAERVAEQVMRMPDPVASYGGPEAVQRMCSECEDEQLQRQELQRQPLEEEEELVQAKGPPSRSGAIDQQAGDAVRSLSGGRPLTPAERGFFEPRMGASFDEVRIHDGAAAAASARSLKAQALAYGSNIVVDRAYYDIGTRAGRRLMAHELTHVMQQGGAGRRAGDGHQPAAATAAIMPYRPKGSVNFGVHDTKDLKEKEFDSSVPDPFIEKITVAFTGTKEVDKETVPLGELSATYAKNGAKPMPSDISGVAILGGYPSQGLSDTVNNKGLTRIEGYGYNRGAAPKGERVGSEWPEYKYSKPELGATMSYAMFFKGKQAVHHGSLDHASLSCVHVDSFDELQRINYHARKGETNVDLTYTQAALKIPCCERYPHKGTMNYNPCKGQDKSKCP